MQFLTRREILLLLKINKQSISQQYNSSPLFFVTCGNNNIIRNSTWFTLFSGKHKITTKVEISGWYAFFWESYKKSTLFNFSAKN